MAAEPWTRARLFAGREPTPAFVEELERLGLLRVVARDPSGEPIYDPDARDTLERVLVLVDAGYQPRDIAVIAHKVGLEAPRRRLGQRAPTLMRSEDVARAAGVAQEDVRAWWTSGWVEATLVTEGAEPLFAAPALEAARALADLATLGLGGELAPWVELTRRLHALETGSAEAGTASPIVGDAGAFARQLREALERCRSAARRWTKRLAAFEKQVERVRRMCTPETARVKPRSALRRKVRTRSTAR